MLLSTLIAALPDAGCAALPPAVVSGITHDSRAVRPGMVFVAIAGFTVDGHRFTGEAAARGAAAVVVTQEQASALPLVACPVIGVPDTRAALSRLAAVWHGRPGRSMQVIGVTGTDGKTTTSTMLTSVLERTGRVAGMMGTAQVKVGARWEPNPSRQTTQEAPDVQRLLAAMRDAGSDCAVVEASSHGLALRKLDDCDFDAAVFTNINEDHLDFHGTREAYWAAKGRLLDLVKASDKPGPHFAVLNAEDRSYGYLRARAQVPVISYAADGTAAADVCAHTVTAGADGSRCAVSGRFGEAWLSVPMPGAFNVANAVAAVAAAAGLGVPLADACAALAGFEGVPGRMAGVRRGQPFDVVIDYAHTGEAFRKLLATLRPLCGGRLIAVFGSAGEQSKERRTGMGRVAAEMADFTVLTSEDPRREDPEAIIGDIAAAMTAAGRQEARDFVRVTDRRVAIRTALAHARPGDLVVLAGKGHERSIIVGTEKQPWDERRVAEEELEPYAR